MTYLPKWPSVRLRVIQKVLPRIGRSDSQRTSTAHDIRSSMEKLKALLKQNTATKRSERSTISNFGLVLPGSKQVHKIQQSFTQSYTVMNQSITVARTTYPRSKTHTRTRHSVTCSLRHLTLSQT